MGENCFDQVKDLIPIPNPSVSGAPTYAPTAAPPSPLTDWTCSFPPQAYAQLCGGFSTLGCCWANDLTILEQNPKQPVFIPPCVMDYLSNKCPTLPSSTYFCTTGLISDVGTINAQITLNLTLPTKLPNLYIKNSDLQFRTILATPLDYLAVNIQIISFRYYDANDNLIVTKDISTAASGIFDFGIVVAYIDNITLATNALFVDGPGYEAVLQGIYQTAPTNIHVVVQDSVYYKADPFIFPDNSSMKLGCSFVFALFLATCLSLTFVF